MYTTATFIDNFHFIFHFELLYVLDFLISLLLGQANLPKYIFALELHSSR